MTPVKKLNQIAVAPEIIEISDAATNLLMARKVYETHLKPNRKTVRGENEVIGILFNGFCEVVKNNTNHPFNEPPTVQLINQEGILGFLKIVEESTWWGFGKKVVKTQHFSNSLEEKRQFKKKFVIYNSSNEIKQISPILEHWSIKVFAKSSKDFGLIKVVISKEKKTITYEAAYVPSVYQEKVNQFKNLF